MMIHLKYSTVIIIALVVNQVSFCQSVDWSSDVAPLIYKNCASCHHEGGIGPFSLLSYENAVIYGHDINLSVSQREMPPWPADPDYRNFAHETYLSDEEITMIQQWVADGMPSGNLAEAPNPPIYAENGSLLERIDAQLAIAPYTLQSNIDEYRWFAISNPFDHEIYIEKIEVFPGLKDIVHHADLFYDLTGNSAEVDALDSISGFNSSVGSPVNSFYINAWQPGANVAAYPKNWGIRVPPEADFVFEIHYGPGGQGKVDTTVMNLQIIANPEDVRPVRANWLLHDSEPVMVDGPLIIPANEIVSFHQETLPFENDVSLISICPHMHLIGKSYKVWMETAAGDSIPLINIPQWDFHWQKYYTFQKIQKVPAGAVIKSEAYYDNTINNHDNPNFPPIDIQRGLRTVDEMFLCYFIYADYEDGDEDIILDPELISTTNAQPLATEPLDLFPNPSNHELFFNVPELQINRALLRIFNVEGKLIYTEALNKQDFGQINNISITGFENGMYFIEIVDGKVKYSDSFVKN